MATNVNTDIDYTAEEFSRLQRDYAQYEVSVARANEKLAELPKVINSDDELDLFTEPVKGALDLRKRLVGLHEMEKQPHLRRGQGADSFFFGLISKLGRRSKTEAAGGLDNAQAAVDDYATRKRAAERARAAAEAAEAARKLREAEALHAAEMKAMADKLAASERARKAENIAARQAEAAAHEMAAVQAEIAVEAAELRASDAEVALNAPVADMVRTRTASGMMAGKEVPFVQLIDRDLVNKELLWAHLKDEHIEMALRSWAKTTGHKKPMPGAIIELRVKGQIR